MIIETHKDNSRLYKPHIAFVGFGEAAKAFWFGWNVSGESIIGRARAYDIATETKFGKELKLQDYKRTGIVGKLSLEETLTGADVVFSLVTADQAQAAASAAACFLQKNALWLDCNSCAPQTKRRNAEIIEASGGRYVDVAVMAPVHPRLHRTPILISGQHIEAAHAIMQQLNMDVKSISDKVGDASSIKLCRSIMIKGLEALATEFALTGKTLGVEDVVLATLEDTFPGFGWQNRVANMLERSMVHGCRRAAEMREAALMVEALGLPARMSYATAAWHQQIGDLELSATHGELHSNTDAVLSAIERSHQK